MAGWQGLPDHEGRVANGENESGASAQSRGRISRSWSARFPQPGPGQVRIRVQACGVCHSDVITKEGAVPGITYPRVPGHEVAGVIDEVGRGRHRVEERRTRRRGLARRAGRHVPLLQARRFRQLRELKICGISYDGGYQEYMVAPVEALAHMPESLDAAEAAPLMCAGITTFNALRHSGALPSDLVAVQGIGGLGHLGIQFAQEVRLSRRGRRARCRRTPRSRKSSARMFISTAPQPMRRPNCRNSAARA